MARGYEEFPQHFPRPGWVEHEPEQIWQATLAACRQALAGRTVTAVGITNQRETAVLWDRSSLAAPRRAVVWQDRRSSDVCDRLRDAGHEDRVRELTGLRFDPYFTGTKLTWLAENDPRLVGRRRRRLGRRRHRRLVPGGPPDRRRPARHRRVQRLPHPALRPLHRRLVRRAVRAASASRALRCRRWSRRTARWAAPTPRRSSAWTCRSPASPVTSRRRCSARPASPTGESKCTYGTGSFVLVNTGTYAGALRLPGCSRRSRGWLPTAR